MDVCKYWTVSIGLTLFHSLAQGYCPAGWLSFRSSCYDFVDQQLIWPEASHTCQAMNSELVTIDNVQEYDFIHTHLASLHAGEILNHKEYVSYWTSGNDIAKEGTWVWGNNEEMEFTHWFPGEPLQQRAANCMALYSREHFMFNDDYCDVAKHRFICEIANSSSSVIVG